MQRRLVTFALLVVLVTMTAFVVPLALAARDLVRTAQLSVLADQARAVADTWEGLHSAQDESGEPVPQLVPGPGLGDVVLIEPGSRADGPDVPPQARRLVAAAQQGAAGSLDTGSDGFAAAPAVFDEDLVGVVLVRAGTATLQDGLDRRMAAIGGLCAALLVGAGLAGWMLARRTARPILVLAGTAEEMAAGDLAVRAPRSDIREVDEVGAALNRLAGRVQELLADERTASAELAHQLRTPLTVLAADVDAVADQVARDRLVEDVVALQRTTDEIITAARRANREGLVPSCDAAAVVAGRAQFWQVLADFQGRDVALHVMPGPVPVRLTEYDLTTAVDVLLQNVFVHTDEGVALGLGIGAGPDGLVQVTVADAGPGFPDAPAPGRTGSTSLGLAIAERLAVASGGRLERGRSAMGGAEVRLLLGPAGP